MQLQFGTDGIRGRADCFPFTSDALCKLGYAISEWSHHCTGSLEPCFLIISDTRESCTRIKKQLLAGIHGRIIDAGVLPSPAALWMLKSTSQFDLAIVISASHNPYHDNGIKLYKVDGKFSSDDEQFISAAWNNTFMPTCRSHTITTDFYRQSLQNYITEVSRPFPANFLSGKTIALDCANGATSHVAPAIFQSFGAAVSVINNNPNGTNINESCGSTHPEQLRSHVINIGADIGFAFDGDGDRLITVAQDGTLKDGDDSLAILATDPEFINEPAVVGTILSNSGIEPYLANLGKKLIRTNVGDRNVIQALTTQKLSIGAEPSGHIIIRPLFGSGDGILAALRLCQTLTTTNNWELNSFQHNHQKTINIQVSYRLPLDAKPMAQVIDSYRSKLLNGHIVVRYSGTEPVLRIMVEAPTENDVIVTAQSLANELKTILDSNNQPGV